MSAFDAEITVNFPADYVPYGPQPQLFTVPELAVRCRIDYGRPQIQPVVEEWAIFCGNAWFIMTSFLMATTKREILRNTLHYRCGQT